MTEQRVQRRLAAILAADVAGYSRLMHSDEEATHSKLTALLLDAVHPAIAEHGGRIVKNTGDGLLAEFPSAVEAVRAAIQFQTCIKELTMAEVEDRRIAFRVGANIGDVIVEPHDIFGDGINIAARIETMAEPGGICISSAVYDQVRGKVGVEFTDLGEQNLKNIERPVRIYATQLKDRAAGAAAPEVKKPLPLPDKPSIAVLPFANMSGDPEQEYFADGMVEEITTALSRFKWLFVIARNSSFTFKGKAVDIKDVGRTLGVRYVLEGEVRKASGKVRITGRLIEAATGTHIWADRFERDMTDIFALQDDVTLAVVSAIQPKLFQAEIALASRRRPEDLTAYDLSLRAIQHARPSTREGLTEALRLVQHALELAPGFASAAALAGECHLENVLRNYAIDPQFERKEAVRLMRLALRLDDGDPGTLASAALISALLVGDCETEIEMSDRAVTLNPNSYHTWHSRGWVFKIAGQPEEAIRSFERAMRMSPVDPQTFSALTGIGFALIELRRFDEAIVAAKKALRHNRHYPGPYRCLASAFAHLGRRAETREAAARMLEIDPNFTISAWIARSQLPKTAKLMIEGFRKAGLTE